VCVRVGGVYYNAMRWWGGGYNDTVLGGPGVWCGVAIGEETGGGYFNDLYDAVAILLLGVDVMLIPAGDVGR